MDYYKVLNLSLAKKKGKITDEMVKNNYESKRAQYLSMKKNKQPDSLNFNIMSDELNAYLQDDYLELLEDAFYALSTENARKHYDELLEMINEHIQNQRKLNVKQLDFKKMIQFTKTVDTKELLDKIKNEASKKYPIQEIDGQENNDNIEL